MLVGRRTADVGERMEAEKPGSVDYPFSGPVFVLTHRPPEPPDADITYLTGDIGEAVAIARSAAGGKSLEILGADVAPSACSGALSMRSWCTYCRCCSATHPLLAPGAPPDRPGTGQHHAVGHRHHPPVPRPQVIAAQDPSAAGTAACQSLDVCRTARRVRVETDRPPVRGARSSDQTLLPSRTGAVRVRLGGLGPAWSCFTWRVGFQALNAPKCLSIETHPPALTDRREAPNCSPWSQPGSNRCGRGLASTPRRARRRTGFARRERSGGHSLPRACLALRVCGLSPLKSGEPSRSPSRCPRAHEHAGAIRRDHGHVAVARVLGRGVGDRQVGAAGDGRKTARCSAIASAAPRHRRIPPPKRDPGVGARLDAEEALGAEGERVRVHVGSVVKEQDTDYY